MACDLSKKQDHIVGEAGHGATRIAKAAKGDRVITPS
jgi:hypothetical protein